MSGSGTGLKTDSDASKAPFDHSRDLPELRVSLLAYSSHHLATQENMQSHVLILCFRNITLDSRATMTRWAKI